MVRRLSSAVFVGRSKELGELRSAADAAVSGGASLVLIAGEAGVGKSRLVTEAAARLQGDGWLVLQGGSVAVGEDGLPFGPLVEALRTLARTVDPDRIAAAAGPSLPELTRLVPELAAVAPDPPDRDGLRLQVDVVQPRVAMTFFGEGSTANGQWHEAMNFAGIHHLPVVFILENNRFAYSTPNRLEFAVDPVERRGHLRLSGHERGRQ